MIRSAWNGVRAARRHSLSRLSTASLSDHDGELGALEHLDKLAHLLVYRQILAELEDVHVSLGVRAKGEGVGGAVLRK